MDVGDDVAGRGEHAVILVEPRALYKPGGVGQPSRTGPAVRTSSSYMPHSHVTELRVRYAETDRMGIVYYANYLVWCEVGRVEFMRALGRDYASLEREGFGLAVAE